MTFPTKPLIALVDDEASVLSAVSRLLRSNDLDCITYDSGEAALADARLLSANCIVLDIQMQGLDGFTVRDRIRAMSPGTPCFFITAHLETESPEWNRLIGKTPYLAKPFDESQFLFTIHRLIRQASI